jgi:hypothetical protein
MNDFFIPDCRNCKFYRPNLLKIKINDSQFDKCIHGQKYRAYVSIERDKAYDLITKCGYAGLLFEKPKHYLYNRISRIILQKEFVIVFFLFHKS